MANKISPTSCGNKSIIYETYFITGTFSSRRNDLKDADRNKILWINLSFLGQCRIKEVFGNTFWKMKVFLPQNKGHFHVLKPHRIFNLICAESKTLHMRSHAQSFFSSDASISNLVPRVLSLLRESTVSRSRVRTLGTRLYRLDFVS